MFFSFHLVTYEIVTIIASEFRRSDGRQGPRIHTDLDCSAPRERRNVSVNDKSHRQFPVAFVHQIQTSSMKSSKYERVR